ncbi:MAG: two-component regulator propeller domain-containing protein [Aureibaculum sp.]
MKIYTTILLVLSILLASCNGTNEAPPLPVLENEYEQPVTKSFELPQADTIAWVTRDPSIIKNLPTKKFNWAKIPSKSFDIEIPQALTEPITAKPFDWNSLPSSPFSLDSLPKQKLNVKVKVLGEPKVVKAGYPVTLNGATRGVMTLDANFGLPGTNFSSFKDQNGMLWFGTTGGITRYDSENLESYGVEQGLNIQGYVSNLFEDAEGRLWVGGSNGDMSVIDFEAKLVYELSNSFDKSNVYKMMEDDQHRIWYPMRNHGYYIIDFEEKSISEFTEAQGLLSGVNITALKTSDGLIWLSGLGVNIIDLKAGKNIKLTQENGLLANFVSSFIEDNNGKIWISGGRGVAILNKNKTEISYLTGQNGLDRFFGNSEAYQDGQGKFWLGTPNGVVFSYSESNGLIEKYKVTDAPGQWMFNMIEDDQGQLWVSVAQGGLHMINTRQGRPANFDTEDGLASNDIWDTEEAKDGKIWFGSNQGIDVYDPVKNTIQHLGKAQGLIDDGNTRLMEDSNGRIWACGNTVGISIIDPEKQTIQQLKIGEDFGSDGIRTIFEDKNGLFWMGGRTGELITLDMENAILKNMVIDSAAPRVINNIIINDASNNIWVGGLDTGIQIINPKTNTRIRLTKETGMVSNTVYSLTKDGQHNIWTATQEGVELIDLTNRQVTTFKTSQGLGANDVYAIAEHKGEIFTGTSNGLTILKPLVQPNSEMPYWKVKTLGQRQGLNLVDFAENSFTFDKNGRFWATLAQTVTVIDEIKEDSTMYPTLITGINILDNKQVFNNLEKIKEKTATLDTLWEHGKSGFSIKNKASRDSSYQSLHNIKWKTVEGPHNIPVGLELPHDQNYLSFNYNGAQFNNPDKVVYRYFLEGIDKNWSDISEQTTSENYRDLPPGDYTFMVASKGFNGVWSKPAEMKFTIMPPWWQSWWAYLIYLAILGLLGLQVHKYQKARTVRKERENAQKKELEQAKEIKKAYAELKATQSQLIQSEKMASLGELTAGIAHEIQNPLNFVNNFSEVNIELIDELGEEVASGNLDEVIALAKDIKENEQKINHHGKRADSIVKGMLQHSRLSNGIKEPTNINALADEYLRLAYHGLRAKDKSFNAKMETDFDESIGTIDIVAQDMGRVILNLITNAFYVVQEKKSKQPEGYDPTVSVGTKKTGKQVLISIQDNGSGIPKSVLDKIFNPFFTTKPSGKGTGLGLSLSYDIVKAHGGELKVDTKEGEGTTFTIVLPANN